MQTTLLGLAIAIILALVTALVGPLLIDWGSHRSLFEAEASRLIGVNVRVAGAIDARLLPSPRLTLHEIAIGNGPDSIRARSLGVEFALGPLMRGEWRAADLSIEGPQLALGLDSEGRIRAPNLAVNFKPDELSIDRLSIVDGTVALSDAASGTRMTLSRMWFNGDARSLVGPVKGEGAVTIAGELFPYRLSVGRLTEDGALKLHINIDPVEHPLSIEADGSMTFAAAEPRFEGTLRLSRPVGIAAKPSGPPVGALNQPWRASAKIKATAQSALLQNVDFQYGSEEQGYGLTGVADFKFGTHPRLDGVLSGRQIDVDRAVGERQPPAAAIRQLAELGAHTIRSAIPIRIGIGIDQVTLGGGGVQNLRGDISSSDGGWNLDHVEFRAPGLTQVRISGRLAVENGGVAFTGPAELDSSDPKTLASWLQGRNENQQGELRPLKLRGDIKLGGGKIAIDQLKAEFDRKPVTGRVSYSFPAGDGGSLDAELKASELDADAVIDFGRALLAGSAATRPQDITLAADLGRTTLAGVEARDVHVRLKADGSGLQLDRVSIGDLGGGSVTATGRIDTGGHAPHGMLSLDIETKQVAAIGTVVSRFAPEFSSQVANALSRIGGARLHANLEVSGGGNAVDSRAQLTVSGNLDSLRIEARARVDGNWPNRKASNIALEASLDAPDAHSLVQLLGLDSIVDAGKGPGQLTARISGPAGGDLALDMRLSTDDLAARVSGAGQYSLSGGMKGVASLNVEKADLRPLRPSVPPGIMGSLPLKTAARVELESGVLTLSHIDATIHGTRIRGHLAVSQTTPHRLEGALQAESGSLPALIAWAIGLPSQAGLSGRGWTWSDEPFAPVAFGRFVGKVSLEFGRAELLPALTARQVRATLHFDKNEVALDDVGGDVAGGALRGTLSLERAEDGLTGRVKITLEHADAAGLLHSSARPPVGGTVGFAMDVAGTGMSPVALVGSLKGSGAMTLDDAKIAGLDPRAFDAVTRAVDQGLPIDTGPISEIVGKSIESGAFAVKHADLPLTVAAGQVRFNKASVDAKDAALSIAGTLDLTDGTIDARLVLSGQNEAVGARPDIFVAVKGPVQAASRTIDVSALTGWLTLRAVENQTKRLRAIENTPIQPPIPAPAKKSKSAPALPAPINIKPAPKPRSAGQGGPSIRSQ